MGGGGEIKKIYYEREVIPPQRYHPFLNRSLFFFNGVLSSLRLGST